MKQSTTGKICLALMSLFSASVVNACASDQIFRTYYLDGDCNYYYVDGMGHTVTGGKYVDLNNTGLPLKQSADGRSYYQDSFGNRIYTSSRCAVPCCKTVAYK